MSKEWTEAMQAEADALWKRHLDLHKHPNYRLDGRTPSPWVLWKLVAEAVAREREACAKLAEEHEEDHREMSRTLHSTEAACCAGGMAEACVDLASAIRSRGAP